MKHSTVNDTNPYPDSPRRSRQAQLAAKRVDFISLRIVREKPSTLYPDRFVRCAQDAVRLLRPYLDHLDREHFLCLNLSTKNEPVSVMCCSIGSLDSTIVVPRDILKSACISNAASVLCAHNHPSGDPTPSEQDVAVTKRLSQCCEMLGIGFLDHLVVGESGRFTSLRNEGLI